jgi:hypothetical protein
VDLTREWPTPIHYLLYASVSLLVDIVRIWRDRPEDLPEKKFAQKDGALPHILPAHAIEVLSSVMQSILQSNKLQPGFKGYLLEVWWRAYWPKYSSAWAQTHAILESLVKGGGFGDGEMRHRHGLAEALRHVDIVMQVSEGGDQIRAAFGLPSK